MYTIGQGPESSIFTVSFVSLQMPEQMEAQKD